MIPHQLTIKGLNSYKQEQCIDFDRLCAAQLFGIFGEVGSGKSTLLDAITLALYGKVDRLGSRHKEAFNLEAKQLLVVLEWSNPLDGQRYRFQFENKRKKNGEVDTPSHTRYQWVSEAWVPVTASTESLLRLSYDHFKRTVILPQGKFMEFLQLGDKDRSAMFQDLFQLDRFDLEQRRARLAARNEAELSHVKGQMVMLAEVDENVLAAFVQKEANYNQELGKQQQLLQEANEVSRLLHEAMRVSRQLVKVKQELQEDEQAHKNLQEQLHALEPALIAAREDAAKIPLWRQEADAWSLAVQWQLAHQEWSKEMGRIPTGTQKLAEKKEIILTLEARAIALQDQLKTLDQALAHSQQLHLLDQWYQQHAQLEQRAITLTAEIARANASGKAAWEKTMQAPLPVDGTLAVAQKMLEAAIQEWAHSNAALGQAQEQHQIKVALADLAGSLEEGTPCPVCGATHHPAPLEAAALHEATEEQQHLLHQMAARKQQLDQAQQGIFQWEKSVAVWEGQWTQVQQQLAQSEQQFPGTATDSRKRDPAFEAALVLVNTQIEQKNQAQQEWNTLQDSLSKLRSTVQQYQDALQQIQQAVAGAAARKHTLEEQIKILQASDYQELSQPEIELRRNELEKQIATSTAGLSALEQRQRHLEQEAANWQGKARQLAQQRVELEAEATQWIHALKQILDSSKVEVYLPIRQSLSHEQTMVYAQDPSVVAFESWKAALELNLKQLTASLSEVQYQIKTSREQLSIKAKLQEKITGLESRALLLDSLKKLFKGKAFVNYVARRHFQHLIQIANLRFRALTRQRLELVLGNDNDFLIRDHLNGGQTRQVATLSGGQLFQASLSLALALAELIRREHGAENSFFFLDEGFGALDARSLQEVMQTLRALRQEKRIVGIISHVDAMQQETETFLEITLDAEKGSVVKGSWE